MASNHFADGILVWDSNTWYNGICRYITQHNEFDPYDPNFQISLGLERKCYIDGSSNMYLSGNQATAIIHRSNYDARLRTKLVWNNNVEGFAMCVRSRHNEEGAEENKFGGYRVSIYYNSWEMYREDYHDSHELISSDFFATNLEEKKEYDIVFICEDNINNTDVDLNLYIYYPNDDSYTLVGSATDTFPSTQAKDKTLLEKKSYAWVRTLGDSPSPKDLQIKQLKLYILPQNV